MRLRALETLANPGSSSRDLPDGTACRTSLVQPSPVRGRSRCLSPSIITQPSAWAFMPPGVVDESAWPFPLGSSCASTLLPDPKPGRRYWACFIEASAFGCGSGAVVSTAGSGCRGALELGWPLPERVVPGSGLFALGS